MKNATLRQLRVFASVARHLSFIRAAEELKLTAPAVSMQIKELEAEVGFPLFDRTSRQVSLTMVGEYVLGHARRVLAAMRDAEDLVARFRGLKTGQLDVGMVSTAKYFLPRMLAQFRQEHPGIEIRLQVADNREEIVSLMQQGDIELAVMGRPPKDWPTLCNASARIGDGDRSPVHAHGGRTGTRAFRGGIHRSRTRIRHSCGAR
jgi:DNA-binding transcriptional LysR family regulator